MGMTVWLNVRTGDSYASDGEDLSALFALQEELDRVASSLSVEPISKFFDETDVRYNMDEEGEFEESEEGWPASAATWHDPASVLRTVEALRAHLEESPKAIAKANEWTQEQVLEDLQLLAARLEAAAGGKKQIHLLVVM